MQLKGRDPVFRSTAMLQRPLNGRGRSFTDDRGRPQSTFFPSFTLVNLELQKKQEKEKRIGREARGTVFVFGPTLSVNFL